MRNPAGSLPPPAPAPTKCTFLCAAESAHGEDALCGVPAREDEGAGEEERMMRGCRSAECWVWSHVLRSALEAAALDMLLRMEDVLRSRCTLAERGRAAERGLSAPLVLPPAPRGLPLECRLTCESWSEYVA
jgi:hypothetical protein